jgi:hypothetical protein
MSDTTASWKMNSEKRNCISKLRGMKNIVLREYGRKIETPRLFLSVYIMARISTIYGNQIVTEYLVFIVFIIDYKSGIRDSKLGIITCI